MSCLLVFGIIWSCWHDTCGWGVCGHQTDGNWDFLSETALSKLTLGGCRLSGARRWSFTFEVWNGESEKCEQTEKTSEKCFNYFSPFHVSDTRNECTWECLQNERTSIWTYLCKFVLNEIYFQKGIRETIFNAKNSIQRMTKLQSEGDIRSITPKYFYKTIANIYAEANNFETMTCWVWPESEGCDIANI